MPDLLTYDTPLWDERVPGTDLRGFEWFDGDSDGPYTLEYIEAILAERPRIAHEFHVTHRPELNYEMLLPERLEHIRICASGSSR
jgi:hypothetical protein